MRTVGLIEKNVKEHNLAYAAGTTPMYVSAPETAPEAASASGVPPEEILEEKKAEKKSKAADKK